MSQRPKISAIITTFNEEHNIAECIEKLLWCDEILVVDSYSTDRTAEIIRSYPKVTFKQHTYYGSAAQKNWAIDHSSHEWILIFDADERCTPELQQEIEDLLAGEPQYEAYSIHRRLFFLNHPIRFSGFQRDQVVRLIKRGSARYPNRRVHADMMTSGPVHTLKQSMDHFMVYDLSEYVQRITKYGIWGAAQGWRDGRRSGIIEVVGRPLWRFFRTFLLQLGLLDGRHGLIFCIFQAYGTFVKWSVLWGWRKMAPLGFDPKLPEFDDNEETWAGLERLQDGSKA